MDRSMAGQKGKEDPFVPVPRDEQKWAMTLLDKYLFSIDAFKFSEEIYSHLQYQEEGGVEHKILRFMIWSLVCKEEF